MRYYHLSTRHDGPEDVAKEFLESRASQRFCGECHALLDRTKGVDIQVDNALDEVPLNFARPTTVGLIRKDLLKTLNQMGFSENFLIGSVKLADGNDSNSIFTYVSPLRTYIRGNPDSPERVCNSCGEMYYHPLGSRYLRDEELPNGKFLESQLNGILFLDEAVAEAVRSGPWKRKISLTQLKVK